MKTYTAVLLGDKYFKIRAREIEVAGAKLMLHKAPRNDGKVLWSVTEPVTGRALVKRQATKAVALEESQRLMETYGLDAFNRTVHASKEAPPLSGLPEFVPPEKEKPKLADTEGISEAVARIAKLTDSEKAAVHSVLNRRTGRLLAKPPSAFSDDPGKRLACAAWIGLQPNMFKARIASAMYLNGFEDCKALLDKLLSKTWPAALDKDMDALTKMGVW
jgi:hypothetical protein